MTSTTPAHSHGSKAATGGLYSEARKPSRDGNIYESRRRHCDSKAEPQPLKDSLEGRSDVRNCRSTAYSAEEDQRRERKGKEGRKGVTDCDEQAGERVQGSRSTSTQRGDGEKEVYSQLLYVVNASPSLILC